MRQSQSLHAVHGVFEKTHETNVTMHEGEGED